MSRKYGKTNRKARTEAQARQAGLEADRRVDDEKTGLLMEPNEIKLSVSGPEGAVLTAITEITKAVFGYATAVRTTAGEKAQDEQDRIIAQAYWDWRDFLERLHIVGPARA